MLVRRRQTVVYRKEISIFVVWVIWDSFYVIRELVRENHQSLSKLAEAFRQLDILQAKNLLQRCQMVNRVIKKLNYWNLESEVKTPDQ